MEDETRIINETIWTENTKKFVDDFAAYKHSDSKGMASIAYELADENEALRKAVEDKDDRLHKLEHAAEAVDDALERAAKMIRGYPYQGGRFSDSIPDDKNDAYRLGMDDATLNSASTIRSLKGKAAPAI